MNSKEEKEKKNKNKLKANNVIFKIKIYAKTLQVEEHLHWETHFVSWLKKYNSRSEIYFWN